MRNATVRAVPVHENIGSDTRADLMYYFIWGRVLFAPRRQFFVYLHPSVSRSLPR